jgi:SHS2 domain-containing protein
MDLESESFEILDHTADLGILVSGQDIKHLFQNAAHAMMKIMVDLQSDQTGSRFQEISLKGTDLTDLLVRWLGEILYLFEGENRAVTRTKIIRIRPDNLDARIETIPFSINRHEILTEIKAVTYHQAETLQEKNGSWKARIIFDL